MRELVRRQVPAPWRAPFERSFGCNLGHVEVLTGPESDRRLEAAGFLALAADGATILLSSRLTALPWRMRLWTVGHELAHTVQLRRGGSHDPAHLESEAWHAAWWALQGRSCAIRGGAGASLAAEALSFDPVALRYFMRFPQLLDLEVKSTRLMNTGSEKNFESLLGMLLDSKQVDFLIDAHGDEVGIYVPLVAGIKLHTTKLPLFMLMALDRVEQGIRGAGDDYARWKRVLQEIDQCNQRLQTMAASISKRKGEEGPSINITWKFDPGELSLRGVDYAKAQASVWIRAVLRGLQVSQQHGDKLIGMMHRVRQKGLNKVDFRSCKIGQDPEALSVFREFFNAQRVGGPDVRSGFVELARESSIDPRAVDLVLKRPTAQLFGKAKGERFAIQLTIAPSPHTKATADWAADSRDAANRWVANCFMSGKPIKPLPLPIHFLETVPPVFPRNPEYQAHIKYAERPKP